MEKEKIMEILNKYPKNEKSNLIQILNEFQERDGYISEQVMLDISKHLGITLAEVFSVVSFYARFTLEHAGKYHITVCLGTACFVKGSERILDRFKEKLQIEVGETTKDGKFSLDEVRCIGSCGLAPVFTVNGEVYGRATIDKVDEVLDQLMKEE